MPPLTETWAAEYLEVIVALLVFALGIPALILQFAVPEELRSVSRRRLAVLRWSAFVVTVIIAVSGLSFVWLLHPCDSDPLLYDQGIGAIIMTVAIILILFVWLIQTREYRRDAVIQSLGKDCARSVRRHGILPGKSLMDLIYLGEQGAPGREKREILVTLNDLAARVQDRKQYAGYGLAELVQGVETTTIGGAKMGDLGNFLQAANVFECILLRLQRCKLSAAPDTATVLWTLGRLGIASLELPSERAALAILQVMASAAEGPDGAFQFASERLFGIGRSALVDAERFLVAVAALSKLEALAERRTPLKGEVAADLLGLLAHFWASGKTARRHAQSILERMKRHFEPSVRGCMEAAIEHQYRIARFDTADKLTDMLEDLKKGVD